jgi:type I restriction enzyme S subunit
MPKSSPVKTKLGQLVDVNKTSVDKVKLPIHYLDTSSIWRNTITNVERIDVLSKVPSRARRLVQENTIIYSLVRPDQEHYGLVGEKDSNLVVSTGFVTLDVKEPQLHDPRYIYYALTTSNATHHLHRIAKHNASSYPSLSPSDVENYEIDLYEDITYQKKVADFLGLIELRKVTINKHLNATIDYLNNLFRFWFIDLNFPNENGMPYKLSGGKVKWHEKIRRNFPIDWTIGSTEKLINIDSGYSFKSDTYKKEGKYGIITIKNVKDNLLDKTDFDCIDDLPSNLPKHCKLSKGDVLISLTGNVGRVCIVDTDNFLLNQRVGVISGSPAIKRFAFLFFNRPEVRKRVEYVANGSSQDNLSTNDLLRDQIVLPPMDLIEEFDALVEPMFEQYINLRNELELLEMIFETYHQKLISGEVKIL